MTPSAAAGRLTVAMPNTNASEAEVVTVLARHGLTLERWLPGLGLARASVRGGASVAAAVAALETNPQIEYATEERLSATVADTPQDEYWGEQWGPLKVGLPQARDLAWGDPAVAIAVVDTGVNYFHWDLRDQIWINPGESEIDPLTGKRTCNSGIAINGQDDDDDGYTDDCRGYNFDSGTNDPADVYGHGTVVAGIAGAATNNAGHYTSGKREGIVGMGGAARIMALRAMNASGAGSPFNIAEAIRYAADRGAQVINLSLTLPVYYNPDDAATLCKATDYAQSKGALIVAASGNHSSGGIQPVSYPAACTGVLAVGASTGEDARAPFSDAGPRLDLVAPGEGIFATLRSTNTSYGLWNNAGNGTSFAAPHAAGAAALVRSLRPDLDQAQVYQLLRSTTDDVGSPGLDLATGWGRLNAARATASALDGLTLALTADPPGVAKTNPTQVRVRVVGPGSIPAGRGARVALASTLGVISPTLVTVDSVGSATATFTGGDAVGLGSVTASLGGISTTLPITISSGIPASIALEAEPVIVPTSGRATVTAAVRDDGGNLVATPLDVSFTASLGVVDPSTVKTSGGRAVTTFNAGSATGVAQIQASTSGLSAALEVPVLGAGEPFTITLDANPSTTEAGGADVSLTATIVDSKGKFVPDGTVITFNTDLGMLSAPSAATKNGKAGVKLTPGTQAGAAQVVARAGLVQGATTVTIVAGPAASVTVSGEPKELVADYNQLATITAVAKDRYGNVAADGVVIQFSTNLGQLVAQSAPVVGGRSQVRLIGGLVAGTAQVTATAPGGASAATTVIIKPNTPSTMALAGQPLELTVGSGASRLRVTLKDAYGNLVSSGIPVTFTTDLGQLKPAGGGADGGLSLVALTQAGVAEADLAPGTVSGVASVRASVSTELRQGVQVIIRPAGAAQLMLSAQPTLAQPGQRVDIAAQVVDLYGNPVVDGVNVTFGVNRGQLYQSIVPTTDGYAYTWFTAPFAPGPVQIVAVSSGVSGAPLTVYVARSLNLPFLGR